MKALITAGGRATRLRPITWSINKHLIPLANRPMLAYAIEKIAETGITEIGINVNPGEQEIQKALGDGSAWGVHLTYLEQQGGPKGLAHIIRNARPFLGDEPFVFYLGDNIILGSIRRFVEKFETGGLDALLALSKVKDPQRFGVPELKDGRIVRVDEKPAEPKSDYAVTGIYVYSPAVFEAVDAVQPSPRGEYEISDVHTWLIEHGRAVGYEEITGWWKDTGKPEDLIEGNHLLLAESLADTANAVIEGEVAPGAVIEGRVRIGKGTVIDAASVIRGPVTIGEDCVIEGSCIGPSASLGDGVRVSGTDIARSIVFRGASIRTDRKRVTDSIIGERATIGYPEAQADRLAAHRLLIGDNSMVEV